MIEKTCRTCAHKDSGFKCMKTGYYATTQRKYPDGRCDSDFSGWAQRASILQRIRNYLFGPAKSSENLTTDTYTEL